MSESQSDILIGKVSEQWAVTQKINTKYFATTTSTNKQAKEQAFSDTSLSEHLIIYFADKQTEGKGRGTNSWTSAKAGSQLLSTWSFMVEEIPQPILSPLIGLALYRAANSTWPFLNWSLKAPNDLYIENKKVAGLLIETLSQGQDHRLLIGLGLNVLAHPKQIETSTSLVENLSSSTPLLAQDWISFLERLIFEFSISIPMAYETLNSTCQAAILKALNSNPVLKEKYVSIDEVANLKTQNRQISWLEL